MPTRHTPKPVATVLAALALALAGYVLGACSSTSSSPPATTGVPALSSIPTIAELDKQLEARSISCKLEYEGLKQDDKTLSLCVIDGEQATLTIWDKPDVLQKFLRSDVGAKGATAVGANWTIDVDTATTAQKIAAALGGTVKAAPATPGSSK